MTVESHYRVGDIEQPFTCVVRDDGDRWTRVDLDFLGDGDEGGEESRASTPATASSTTTTQPLPAPPVPEEASVSDRALCEYLVGVDGAQQAGSVLWFGAPTPDDGSAPLLVLGFALDRAQETEADLRAAQGAFVAAALPYLQAALRARNNATRVTVISTGTAFDIANKTLWEFERRALDDMTDPNEMAAEAVPTEWDRYRLPFAYLEPHPSRLDALGERFVEGGSPCSGLT